MPLRKTKRPAVHKAKRPWVLNSFLVLLIAAGCSFITAIVVSNYLNAKVAKQGRDGLQLFYTQSLAQCRLTRANTLILKDGFAQLGQFSDAVGNSLKLQQQGAEIIVHDPKQSKKVRDAAKVRVAGYRKFVAKLPVPRVIPQPPYCTDLVKSPTQLAQQVRNTPGKHTTTTVPGKTTPSG